MRFPSVSQYVEAVSNAFGLFRTLETVVPRRNAYGEVSFCAGNYAAVFHVSCGGVPRALKCYTRLPDYSDEIYGYLGEHDFPQLVACRWLRDEFYVYDECDRGTYYPVLDMEWVDGHTLGREVARLCYEKDREALTALALHFDRFARWLLAQEFAHGDLKQDNIMVTPSGELRLIDLDGMFVPALAGRRCTMVGSPAYQHPGRDGNFFCKAIDDYPIALISLCLHALSGNPELYARRGDGEDLLFNATDLRQKRNSLFEDAMQMWQRDGNTLFFSLGNLLLSPEPELGELPRLLAQLCGECVPVPPGFEVVDDTDPCRALIRRRGLYGYADLRTRRTVLEPVYRSAEPFSEGLALVRIDGPMMFIDDKGCCRIDCSAYDSVSPFRGGRALVCTGGRYGFIDRLGREVVPLEYEFASGFREGAAVVRERGKYGYIDPEGNMLVKPAFCAASRFIKGIARVEKRGIRQNVDKNGRKEAVRSNNFYIFKKF